jgi:DNA-binding protein
LKEELDKASGRKLVNALSIALYVEESMMEKNYFEIINGDSEELKQTLRKLTGATQIHIARVRETLDTYRNTAQ